MRTTNFDALAASSPLDRNASIVRDGSGDLWSAKIPEHHQHWKTPQPIQPRIPGNMPNYTGVDFGRLKVIGYHGDGRWLVRCACGDYELRRTKAIRHRDRPQEQPDDEAMCWECARVKILRKRGNRKVTDSDRKAQRELLERISSGEKAA